ncbi:MAG: diphthine synthase [Candidatus Diapherotrites archaeon]|nr:diphthine synthase [Candidatus Diapherotrites archaeon]
MLYLIGAGLNPWQISLEGLSAIKKCRAIFIDTYTSQFAHGTLEELEETIGKKPHALKRAHLEENAGDLIEKAKDHDIALLIIGNPLTATTHIQLALDAKKKGVECTILPGISIINYLPFTGLDAYKFGRTATIVEPQEGHAPTSFFDYILINRENDLHTPCLLDIRAEEKRLLSIPQAIGILEETAQKKRKNIGDWVLIGLAGMGGKKPQIKAGTPAELKAFKFTSFPQSLIVCGKLNEKELEALKTLGGLK